MMKQQLSHLVMGLVLVRFFIILKENTLCTKGHIGFMLTTKDCFQNIFLHYIRSAFLPYIQRNAVNSSVTSVRRHMLENFPVPLPSIKQQKRIVAILDRFDSLVNDIHQGMPAEISARHKQYEYYRDKLLTFKEKVL